MAIDFSANYFDLFSLPAGFDLDLRLLAERYRELQSGIHPDRFANQGDQARRLSVQAASLVNQAYDTLRDPIKRAFYLLELKGVARGDDRDTTADSDFLMRQMALRERLESLSGEDDPLAAAERLADDVDGEERQLIDAFKAGYGAGDYLAAQRAVQKLQFFERLKTQLEEVEARLEDQLI